MGFTEEGGKGKRSIVTLEGDELRGGKTGDRHRALILYQNGVSAWEDSIRHFVVDPFSKANRRY
jgi:hypothetical protein